MQPFTPKLSKTNRNIITSTVVILIVAILLSINSRNHLLFHSFTSALSVIIYFSISIVFLNAYRFLEDAYLFLGVAFFFVGILEIFHALTYLEGDILPYSGHSIAFQLRFFTQAIKAISIALTITLLNRRLSNLHFTAVIYLGITSAILLLTFSQINLPFYTQLTQSSSFRLIAGYTLSVLFTLTLILLYRKKHLLATATYRWLAASLGTSAVAEIFSAYDLFSSNQGGNPLAHLFSVLSLFFLHKSLIETTLQHAYNQIFKVVAEREKALKQSQEHFRLFYENSPLGYQSLNENGNFLDVNPAWLATLGYKKDEVKGKWFGDFLASSFVDHFRNNFPRFKAAGEIRGVQFEMLHKNGQHIFVEFDGKISYDEQGHFKQTHCVLRDITKQVIAQRALQESEARYRAVVEEQVELVIRYRPGGVLTFVNQSFCKAYGGTKEDWLGKYFPSLIDDNDRPNVIEKIQTLSLQNPIVEIECHSKLSDQKSHNQHWIHRIICDPQDSILEIQAVGRDTTREKQNLKDLMTAQKLAGLGTFAAGMAHEINSPLQVITMQSKGLLNTAANGTESLPDIALEKIKMINRNAWRISEIVKSLKTYTQMTIDDLETYDLKQIIEDAIEFVSHNMPDKLGAISITKVYDEKDANLLCKRSDILQMLINLLKNAIDAMPQTGELTIQLEHDLPTQQIILQITDTGMGMPEETRLQIFDPFFTTKEIGQGAGLGLTFTRNIVNAHHGNIHIDSTEGKGTTVTIIFPAQADLKT